jgi:hypothetical protein
VRIDHESSRHPLFKKLHEIPALVDHLMVIVFMLHSCALPLPSFPVSHPNLLVRPRHPTTLCGFNERGTGPPWEPPACACPQTQTRKPSNCHHACASKTPGNPQTAVANNPQTTPKIQGLRLRKDSMGSKQWPTRERIRTGQTEHSLLPVSYARRPPPAEGLIASPEFPSGERAEFPDRGVHLRLHCQRRSAAFPSSDSASKPHPRHALPQTTQHW